MKKIDIKSTLGGLIGKDKPGKGLYSDSGGFHDGPGSQERGGGQGGGYGQNYDDYPAQQGGYNAYPAQRQEPDYGGYSDGYSGGYSGGYADQRQNGGYDGNYPPRQQDAAYGGYPARQQDPGYGGYPAQQQNAGYSGGYPDQRQNSGYSGGYPDQRQNSGYSGGYPDQRQDAAYGGYPGQGQNAAYGGYPDRRQDPGYGGGYGYNGQENGYPGGTDGPAPPAPNRKKAGFSGLKKGVDIGGLVGNLTGGVKGSIEKLGSRIAKPKKTYSDEDIVPDAGSRTAGLSDIQASELGAAPAAPSAVPRDDFDAFLDDDFDAPLPSYPPSPAGQSAAADAQGPGRFRRIAEQAAAAAVGNGSRQGAYPQGESPREGRSRTAYERESAMEREAASERVNYKFTPDVVYDQHRDDIGFVPPASAAPHNHLRYKRRNRRPMKMWLKTSLTVLCCALFFSTLISLFFISMMTSRVNYVGDSVHNTVYLTVDEKRALAQEETSIEENENEFTVPTITERTDKDVKLILLIASDEAFASGKSSNCDSFLLVAIDNRYKQIKLISIMSELYARIPGYYSNRLGKAFYYDTAKGDYSLSILRQTIYDNFRLSIDNYVVVDYKALETLVNRVGGVPMELTVQEAEYMRKDPKYGLFPRYTYGGHYNMSGAETLNYVRMRKVGDGAFDRTLRQRKVFYELVSKLGDLSFIQLSELTYAMLPLLGTDMSKSEVLYYFRNARSISEYQIDQLRIPIEGSFRFGEADVLGNKIEVLVTNYAFTSEALRDYIYDNDSTYQGGAYAEDVVIPDVAPLPEMLEEQEGQ